MYEYVKSFVTLGYLDEVLKDHDAKGFELVTMTPYTMKNLMHDRLIWETQKYLLVFRKKNEL